MDAKRASNSLKRFFIVGHLDPRQGVRVPMRQASVFSARKLIESTMASFTSVSAFGENGVTCTVARVDLTSDGGVLFDGLFDTQLSGKVGYVVGFAFRNSGFGDCGVSAFGFSGLDGHRTKFSAGSPWVKAHWNEATTAGLIFEISVFTDMSGSVRGAVDTWMSLFPTPFHFIDSGENSSGIDNIIAGGGDPFDGEGASGDSVVGLLAAQSFFVLQLSSFLR